ncbi:MAG: hypothetical protein HC850_01205 [Rhodomicrobium sp.]|nr:hypothetical protein [Rhodomicrobium sp.]
MATTYDTSVTLGTEGKSGSGFAARLFNRFVEARQKEANRQILCYLQGLDAETLKNLGYSSAQINQIKAR